MQESLQMLQITLLNFQIRGHLQFLQGCWFQPAIQRNCQSWMGGQEPAELRLVQSLRWTCDRWWEPRPMEVVPLQQVMWERHHFQHSL